MAIQAYEQTNIVTLVTAMFNTAPSAATLSWLAASYEANGKSLAKLADMLAGTTDFANIYAGKVTNDAIATQLAASFSLTKTSVATDVGTQAYNYFMDGLAAGKSKQALLLDAATFLKTTTDTAWATPKALLVNKADVAEYYAATAQGSTNSSSVLTGVTADTATVAVAKTNAGTVSGSTFTLSTGADNISGTAGNDTINGVVDFNAGTAPGTASSYGTADVINAGAGVDALNLTLANASGGAIASFSIPTISGVETVNIKNVSGQDLFANGGELDVSTYFPGVTAINDNLSTNKVFLKGIANGTSIGLIGNGAVTLADLQAAYTATATSITLNIANGVGPTGTTAPAVTVTGAAATTATINSTGAANTIGALTLGTASTVTAATINATTNLTTGAWTAAALKTLTITGAGSVNTSSTALAATVTSVDASANTGGVTTVSGAKTTAFTGGSGNDKLTIGTLVYDSTAKINGGTGTDTLAIADDTATLFTTAAKANISGFEVLEVSGANKTFDFEALTGLTALNIAAATSATINKLGAATPVTITGDQTTLVTINVKDATNPLNTSDSLTLTLDKAGAATATSIVTVADIKSDGLETLNIVSSGVSTSNTSATTDDNVITTLASLSSSNINKIVITGASDLNLTTGAIARSVNIDGSAATGKLTIDASANTVATGIQGGAGNDAMVGVKAVADVLVGGAGNDRLIAGIDTAGTAAADIMTGGAGADKFVFNADTLAHMLATSNVTTTASIKDFSYTDGDKIEISHGGTAAQVLAGTTATLDTPTAFKNAGLVSAATLTLAATAAFADADQVTSGSQALGTGEAVYFTWNNGTTVKSYIVVNDGTGAFSTTADMVIDVTGITLKSGDASLGSLTVADYFA